MDSTTGRRCWRPPDIHESWYFPSLLKCRPYLTGHQSYICGTLNVYAWIATTAGIAIIVPQVILAIVIANDATYVPKTWHYFLLYQIVNILICVHNIFTLKKTLRLYDIACMLPYSLRRLLIKF